MKLLASLLIYVALITSPLFGKAGELAIPSSTLPELYPRSVIIDPIREARILSLAKTTFPNLATQLNSADLLKRAIDDPSMRGNLRGRLAEEIFDKNFSSEGWKHVASKTAPQNDFWRRLPDGTLEGAQVKVHADVQDYIRSMLKDDKAEKFVVPDDHYDALKKDYEIRRLGALRGGNVEKAADYAHQSSRLMKLGRNFNELEGAVVTSAKHYRAISVALQQAGKSLSYIGIALGIIEGSIATVEFAEGKTDVSTYVTKIGKIGVGGVSFWYIGMAAAEMAASAGAVGLVPIAVAILVGGATYLVVDWGIDQTVKSLSFAKLTDSQLKMIWPANVPIVPTDKLKLPF